MTFMCGCAEDFATVINITEPGEEEPVDPGTDPEPDAQTMKLGSYNLWISNKGTGDYIWTSRRAVLAKSIVDNGFDIFGFQEANATIQTELPVLVEAAGGNYEWWFVGRDTQDGKTGEALGIAYDPDRFELSEKNFFWLSETPDQVSYGWDETGYHRIAACAMVKDKLHKRKFFMMVTHGPLSDNARAAAATLLVEREEMYNPEGIPSILVGDMNATPTDAATVTLSAYWDDAYTATPAAYVFGPMGTFNSHSTSTDLSAAKNRIDYIYVRGDIELKSYRVDNTVYNGIYPSDHCPVISQMNVNYTPDEVEGAGTETDPFLLKSVANWNAVGGAINSDNAKFPADACYKLTADIDFTDKTFVAWKKLLGTLDGNGCAIKNITATNDTGTYGPICTNTGLIKNLAVEAAMSSAATDFGGVVGTNDVGGVVDNVTFTGTLTGTGAAAYIGGIVGRNKSGVVVNCGCLGGEILAGAATKAENCGGIVGGITNAGWVINCYSWIGNIVSSNNNIGGIVGFVGNDSFVINSYSTLATITAGGTYCSAVAYSKVGNLQNIYGNADCTTSKAGAICANDKGDGTSILKTTTGLLLTLDAMKTGSVTVPSSGAVCADFTAALNAGVAVFNAISTDDLPTKPAVTLRDWKTSATYPVLE